MTDLGERIFYDFNAAEAVFWMAIGTGFLVALCRSRKDRDLLLATGLLFLAFGGSDLVEIQTGAWYSPWWLLVWKASNVVGLAAMYALARKRRAARGRC